MWLLYALLSAITAALVAIFGKLGLSHLDSTLATTLRSSIMFIFLILTTLTLRKLSLSTIAQTSWQDWMFIIISGICGALSWLFYFMALKEGLVSRVMAIDRLSLVFAIILSVLFLGEVLTGKMILGLVLMVAGAWLLI